jgi:hypothetical protein
MPLAFPTIASVEICLVFSLVRIINLFQAVQSYGAPNKFKAATLYFFLPRDGLEAVETIFQETVCVST